MDHTPGLFLTCHVLESACWVYIASQFVKGIMGFYKFLNDKDEKEMNMWQEYRCIRCGLQFNHYPITAEDEKERDLCPACGKPIHKYDREHD